MASLAVVGALSILAVVVFAFLLWLGFLGIGPLKGLWDILG